MRPQAAGHAGLMDGVYRRQRHVYDLTRKFYLLGRDRLIRDLDAPADARVLELGCGTGRNLALAAARHPDARFHGLDISREMLATAERRMRREHIEDIVTLVRGDAAAFDPARDLGVDGFERVYFSYTLSMIPAWEDALRAGLAALAPGGSLHIVDFGRQEGLPGWFRGLLRRWLARFHVAPRDGLREVLESESKRTGASLRFESLFGGYAVHAVIGLPARPPASASARKGRKARPPSPAAGSPAARA